MKIGIVGLPGSGKSTVFNSITQKSAEERDFTKPHLGTIFIPDERLDFIASVIKPKKITYSEITFLDMPGYNPAHIQELDALIYCVGTFQDRDILKDLKDFEADLILRDLEAIQKRIAKIEKELKRGIADLKNEYAVLLLCKKSLEEEEELRFLDLTPQQEKLIAGYQFLSRRPFIVISNIAEEQIGKETSGSMEEYVGKKGLKLIEFCGKVESEISELPEDERPAFLKESGIKKSAREKFIQVSYEMLDLIHFYTTKGNETRSWMIKRSTAALDAAGKIHTDIRRGFIRAEVVNFKDFKECGSLQAAKEKGFFKVEGKEYVVQDGDIINFRFNV
ncbi:MAG: redox-regulated ATPase YchF [Candidatus Omnitrophica bacterium]|nr:redox-regulated ATPase YchF [Candidatus Omnitrophota bacterium]